MANFEFLKGNIEVIILNSLYQKDRYGYEIVKEIKEKTQSTYEIKQPTLYAYLKRLEIGGLIESYWGEESSGGRRRYYKLTKDGKAQCESFLSEWKYQKTVMDSLVADEADAKEITQETATPLLGSKIKKHRTVKTVSVEEQQNLSALLEQLTTAKTQEKNLADEMDVQESQSSVRKSAVYGKDLSLKSRQEKSPEPKRKGFFGLFRANKNNEESVATHTKYSETPNNQSDAHTANSNRDFQLRDYEEGASIPQKTDISNSSYSFEDAPQQKNPQNEQQEIFENEPAQGEYFAQQRDKEVFLEEFNKKVQRIIDGKKNADDTPPYEQSAVRNDEQAEEDEKNYKYVLGNALKKQLTDAASIPEATVDTEEKFSQSQNDEPLTMEALVDTFALQGVKVKLYNKETSSYSPRAMLYKNKINLLSSWFTYITFACIALFIWLGFKNFLDAAYAIAFITVPSVLPIALTVLYFVNPSKKVSPKFDFKYHIINTFIAFVLLAVLIFTLFLLLGGQFVNTQAVLSYIVFPAIAAASIPLYILYYKLFFKKALV